MRASALLAGAALFGQSFAAYKLVEDMMSGNFYDHFDFFEGSDPTHGFVDYVNEATAKSGGFLSGGTGGHASWGVDSKNVVSGNGGRQSVRLSSKKAYTHMLVVIKADSIPIACGAWPAFWSFGPNWPASGEIDIIEGVNLQSANQMTLHTNPGCNANGPGDGILSPLGSSCAGNTGCGFVEKSPASYSGANAIGGGVWAMEWTSEGIKIWWWNKNNPPRASVLTENPDPSGWGPPSMNVAKDSCDIDTYFKNHNIIFDTTFCGDWAGQASVWSATGCGSKASTCQDFVANNPSAYKNAKWDVSYLKVFQES